jgi:hypothetical protein
MRELSQQAQAAKLIRKELKAAFPGIKFSVTSEGYSMGDNVNISWTNGPTCSQVKEISDKYQYGHFDGMTDCYEYSNNRNDLPQSKFVFTNREITKDIYETMYDVWFSNFAQFEAIEGTKERFLLNGLEESVRSNSSRHLSRLDLRQPITNERIYDAQF